MPTARRVRVEGRVQGVGFRWATMFEARRLDVSGWVRNLPDGGVEVFAQGKATAVDALVDWLRRGPIGASVHRCDVATESPHASLVGFEIR